MADLSLFLLTLLWGTTFTLVKVAVEIGSTSLFLATRFATPASAMKAMSCIRPPHCEQESTSRAKTFRSSSPATGRA